MNDLPGLMLALPIILPLLAAGATLITLRSSRAQSIITMVTLAATTTLSLLLLVHVDQNGPVVLAVGGWALPFGIALVADRLAAFAKASKKKDDDQASENGGSSDN